MKRKIIISLLALSCYSSVIETAPRLVAYYTNWAQWRKGKGKYVASQVAPIISKLTDLNYAFAFFNYKGAEKLVTQDFKAYLLEFNDADMFKTLNALKAQSNPELNIFLSFGGWTFNDPGQLTTTFFSQLVAGGPAPDGSGTKYNNFITSAFALCDQHNIQGIDFDWENPAVPDRGGSANDYQNYLLFMDALQIANTARLAAGKKKLLITAAVPAHAASGFTNGTYNHKNSMSGRVYKGTVSTSQPQSYIDWLSCLSTYFDWFNLMTYDYFGPWSQPTNENAPLFPLSHDALCIQKSVQGFLTGMTKAAGLKLPEAQAKIVVGIPAYAKTFAGVAFPSKLPDQLYGPGCNFSGPGAPGEFTAQAGTLAYYEVLNNLSTKKYTGTQTNPITKTAYAWNQTSRDWASYDSVETVTIKGKWIASQGLGGGMLYALDYDDFNNQYPLTTSLSQALGRK